MAKPLEEATPGFCGFDPPRPRKELDQPERPRKELHDGDGFEHEPSDAPRGDGELLR